ncbi:MAG: hypothetical protein ACFWUD_02020 [Thermocaproicibacter melissae]|jgi:two-component system, sensor histidine kinase YesM
MLYCYQINAGVLSVHQSGKFSSYLKKSYIHYASILMLIMSLVFFAFSYFNLRFTIVKTNQSCNGSVGSFVNEQYRLYTDQVSKIAESSNIKNVLLHRSASTEAFRELYAFTSAQLIKPVFYLFDSEGNLVLSNLYQPNQAICQGNRKLKEAIGFSKSSPEHVYSGVSGIQYDNGQKTVYLFCKAVTNQNKAIGFLCFDLTADSIDKVLRKNIVDMIILTDRFDNAFYYTNNSVINSMGKCELNWSSSNEVKIDDKPYYGISTLLSDSNIKVITLSSTWAQKQVMSLGIIFLCSLMVLMGILIIIFAKKVAQNISQSLDALLYAVQQCRDGNIGYRINSVTFEEFQILYDEFNKMMVKLQALIKNNSELLERKRMMEVSQLEKQFNPHFVFNVMETMKYEILIDPQQAARMMVAFANLMRYSINYGNSKVPLQTDISYVKDYLMLQKMRFNQRLNYHIDIDKEILQYHLPKLLIQPVVENCLTHGINNVEHIDINIIGKRVEDDIEFVISDNGCGIPNDKLMEIRQLLNTEDAMPSHIGLYNIQRQIKLLYGDCYGLTLNSEFGCGTEVRIKIPIERA